MSIKKYLVSKNIFSNHEIKTFLTKVETYYTEMIGYICNT